MKKVLALAAVAALTSAAAADSVTQVVDIAWDGGLTGEVATASISLPALASIDSISIDLAHTWGGDFLITLTGDTNGSVFELMNDETVDAGGFQSGNFEMGIADNDGSLANVAPYEFVAPGSGIDMTAILRDDLLGGFSGIDANSWTSGALAADTYTLSVTDLFAGDPGAVGSITVNYTIPAPGAIALLGLAGLAGGRRRRA